MRLQRSDGDNSGIFHLPPIHAAQPRSGDILLAVLPQHTVRKLTALFTDYAEQE
ncbi:MAG: hypothetical protein LUG18_14120 [Candidatus Azobacteroides sp.]|nr:hypothetical protein [Candidatus Azobacteroides sp.]